MSLVGFQARNHPQQVASGGAKLHVDDMATPPELFDPLNERFGFTLDAAASEHNMKCERFYSAASSEWSCSHCGSHPHSRQTWCERGCGSDYGRMSLASGGLELRWAPARVWCNPPYSEIAPWIEKAHREFARGALVVMLLPANRTEQGWWQRGVEPYRDDRSSPGPRVEFLPGRPRFIRYEDGVVRPNERPPFGCCLLIWSAA
jgi:phage N-6-adenine-methyltransferase